MKKTAQFLTLLAVLIFASQSNAGAYMTCNAWPSCNLVYEDCEEANGNWYSEFGNYCVDSNNQVREWHSYSCFGRGVFQQGTCLN